MSDSGSRDKNSVTEVAEESFVRARPPEIERGTVLAGRYQVEDTIGKGGSGIVLRVFDRVAQNVVALKVLKAELAHDGKWERRFFRELRLGRPIQHPNVCRIFDIGEADGHRFLTMELARGGSLRDELKRIPTRDQPIGDRLADAKSVILGLAALHAAGVVHRDFKPDNLLRMDDGRLVLSDFGLATEAANAPGATVMVGTPHYMAPEVLAGEPGTSRSDVWALGVVIHEIFFGQRPERRSVSFDGSTKGPLRPATRLEADILVLCERCLVDAPLERPADAGVVADMFDRILSGRSFRQPGRGRRLVALLSGLAVLASIAGVVVRRRHLDARANHPSTGPANGSLVATGTPSDWSKSAKTIAELPAHVHCFSLVDERTARVVWGAPRRADDIDIMSGARHRSPIATDTYQTGCPQLSPKGNRLLFSTRMQGGASQIVLSEFADGRHPVVVTSGDDPLWLTNESLVYNVDGGHVGVFSLPTMGSALLAEPAFGKQRMIVDKSANRSGNAIALLVASDTSEFGVAIYEGRNFEKQSIFPVQSVRRIQFSEDDSDELFLSSQLSKSVSTLAVLDQSTRTIRNVGEYPGFDIVRPHFTRGVQSDEGRVLLLARRVSSDVWLYDGQHRTQLTFSGDNYSAARSSRGGLLLSRWAESGDMNIWWHDPKGSAKQLTFGSRDVEPSFLADERAWTYADYAQKSIMICAALSGSCRVLRRDEFLPAWPRFSPRGDRLAYVTEVGASKLVVVSTSDGTVQATWDAYYECPPVWSSATTIWSVEAASGHFYWSEHDAISGSKTGKRLEIPGSQITIGEVECWPPSTPADSPLFQRERVETAEASRLLSIAPPSPR